MPEKLISVDEFMSKRHAGAKGDKLFKAAKAPTSWSEETRSAVFVMSTQDEDRDGDVVFTAGIDTTEFEKNPVALLFHKSREFPIGTWSNLQKGARQLEGTCTFIPEGVEDEADVAAKLVAAGVLRACSIGFIPKTIAMRTLENGDPTWSYEIRECELVECSIVPIPANPGALIKSADGDMRMAKELIEEVLDTYSRTPEGLLIPRAEYEKAYRVVVEKIAPPAPTLPEAGSDAERSFFERLRKALGIQSKAPEPPPPAPVPTAEEIAERTAKVRARAARIAASQAKA